MSAKLAIVINLDRLKELLLEFLAERAEFSSDDDNLKRQLLFSEFLSWARKCQMKEATNGNQTEV